MYVVSSRLDAKVYSMMVVCVMCKLKFAKCNVLLMYCMRNVCAYCSHKTSTTCK